MDGKHTEFTFTLTRPTPGKVGRLFNVPGITLCFYSLEIGPISKVEHLQGYLEVESASAIRPFALKKLLPGFYIEPARCSLDTNLFYCSKTNDLKFFARKNGKLVEVDRLPLDKENNTWYSSAGSKKYAPSDNPLDNPGGGLGEACVAD